MRFESRIALFLLLPLIYPPNRTGRKFRVRGFASQNDPARRPILYAKVLKVPNPASQLRREARKVRDLVKIDPPHPPGRRGGV